MRQVENSNPRIRTLLLIHTKKNSIQNKTVMSEQRSEISARY